MSSNNLVKLKCVNLSDDKKKDEFEDLNVILEDDELELDSNSVESADEDFNGSPDREKSEYNDKSSKDSSKNVIPYSHNQQRAGLNRMSKVVNFIRKKSSNNSL